MKQPTEEQKAKAKERRERFRSIVKQVADMSDEQKAHLTARIGAVLTCEGRALSLHNTLILLTQCPTVSMVGGFQQWIKAGRAVKKGEHGHMIWFPRGKGKDSEAPAEPTAKDANKPHVMFLIGTVFDIAQTQEIETGQPVTVVSPEVAEAFGMAGLPNVCVAPTNPNYATQQ